jgi:hypothetical protein
VLLNSLFLYRAIDVREVRIDSAPKAFKRKARHPKGSLASPTLFLIPYLDETLHLPPTIVFGLSLRRE